MFVDGVSRGNRGCKRLAEILAAYRVVCGPVGLPISHRDKYQEYHWMERMLIITSAIPSLGAPDPLRQISDPTPAINYCSDHLMI